MFGLRTDLIRNIANIAKRCVCVNCTSGPCVALIGWQLGSSHQGCCVCSLQQCGTTVCPRLCGLCLTASSYPFPSRVLVPTPSPCSQLHEHYYEVPAPIREYIQEVKAQLAMLTGRHIYHAAVVTGGSFCTVMRGFAVPLCFPTY